MTSNEKTIQKAIFDANPRNGIKFSQDRSKQLVHAISEISKSALEEAKTDNPGLLSLMRNVRLERPKVKIKLEELTAASCAFAADMIYAGSAPSVVGFPKQCVERTLVNLIHGEEEE